jgi:hypothetical protein
MLFAQYFQKLVIRKQVNLAHHGFLQNAHLRQLYHNIYLPWMAAAVHYTVRPKTASSVQAVIISQRCRCKQGYVGSTDICPSNYQFFSIFTIDFIGNSDMIGECSPMKN